MRQIATLILLLMSFSFLTQISYADVQSQKNMGHITVYSNKSKEVDPDIAEISLTIKTSAKTAEIASSENKSITSRVIESVKPKLDIAKEDSIKTSNFSLSPQYTYPKDGKPILVGYSVQNTLRIKTQKVSSVGSLIDTAIKSGANQLSNLSFSLSDNKSNCDDLYSLAVKDAQSQASVIAKSLGSNLNGIKSINASCSVENPNNRFFGAMMVKGAADSSESAATPLEAGKIKINASITAEFNVQ